MAWQDIDDAEIAPGAPITQELLQKLDARDKAMLEGPAGGRFEEVITTAGTPAQFLRVFIPRGASAMYVQCQSGAGIPSSDARARIKITDGTHEAFSEFLSYSQGTSFVRDFPPVPISADLRGKLVDVYLDPQDAVGSTIGFAIQNDTMQGFGVRFGGPFGPSTSEDSFADDGELLPDPGVEAWTAGVPDKYQGAITGADAPAQETTIIHGGSSSAHVTADVGGGTGLVGIRTHVTGGAFTLEADKDYTWSGWVRVPSGHLGNGHTSLTIFNWDDGGGLLADGTWDQTGATTGPEEIPMTVLAVVDTWVQLSYDFDTHDASFGGVTRTDMNFRLLSEPGTGPDEFYFDDDSVRAA